MEGTIIKQLSMKIYRKIQKRRAKKSIYRGKKQKMTLGNWLLHAFMIVMVAFSALPLVYMICTAFKPLDELYIFPPRYFVRRPTLQNFSDLAISLESSTVPFVRYIFNSLLVTVINVLGTVFVSSLGAYGLVIHKPVGNKMVFNVIIAALMFSPHVTQIPRYMVVNSLNIIDSYWALIIPNIAVAYNFFLMKQFTEQIPNELLDSARVDGANEMVIYWKIVMPALTPAWSTLIVFSFVSNWNDYFSPLIYITDLAKKTLPLALQTISGGGSIARAGAVAAATMLMTLPTIVIFTTMQAKVLETMTYSGIKG
jgi:ABC-type glycerol-3-phosphate transport system permease component